MSARKPDDLVDLVGEVADYVRDCRTMGVGKGSIDRGIRTRFRTRLCDALLSDMWPRVLEFMNASESEDAERGDT